MMAFRHMGSRDVSLDPEIKSLVIELNREGYKTTASCAGHGQGGAGIGSGGSGFVYFAKSLSDSDAKIVIQTMRKHGCNRVGFPPSLNAGGKLHMVALFSPMGKIKKLQGGK
jgi:hypothetical protein